MAHDLNNPRTKNYSNFKSILINIELFIKKCFYMIFIFLNLIFHTRAKKYIDLGNYRNMDNRFINFVFLSLKKKYNFSYNLSFSIVNFIKKIGFKNFILYGTPNLLIKKDNRLKFLLNANIIGEKEVNFNTNYFSKKKDDNKNFFLPYYMYPKIYNRHYKKLKKLKDNKKLIKIFFSGSTNKEVYKKFTWYNQSNDKLLNRIEIINYIIENFKDKVSFLNDYNDINKINFKEKPILLSINDGLIKKSKTNLSNLEHLTLISKSQFLLTAPGADMPLCHHLIEAIKMKTIPISNYANLHHPNIESENYLSFNDYNSLKESIIRALEMNNDGIKTIQDNLEKFYDDNLSPSSFLDKFENRTQNEIISCNDVESLSWLD